MGNNGTKIVLSGRGLAHHNYNKRQVACLAANVHVELRAFKPSLNWLSRLFGVSQPYISAALRLSPEQRTAIINGPDSTSFVSLLKAPEPRLALPKPKATENDDPDELIAVVRKYGTGRVLDACVAIEAAE